MTTVTDMNALAALDPGTIITVGPNNSNTWERAVDGRWKQGVFVIDPDHLTGDVVRGRVRIGVVPEAGQVWSNDSYAHYLIERISEDDQRLLNATSRRSYPTTGWWVLQFYSGSFHSLTRMEEDSLTSSARLVTTQSPDWLTPALPDIARDHLRCWRERLAYADVAREAQRTLESQQGAAREAAQNLKRSIETGLHAYIAEHGEARGPLDELLVANGMRRADEVTTVQATALVHRYHTLSPEVAKEALGLEHEVSDVGQMLVTTRMPMEVTIETQDGQCGCTRFHSRHVRTWLREQDIDFYESSYENVVCSSLHCQNKAGVPAEF